MILYDNYNIDYDSFYEAYVEWCKDNEIKAKDNQSDSFFNFVWDEISCEWDDLMTNLKYDKDAQEECIVLGSLGLWHGRYEIECTKFDYLSKAILECVKNIDYIIIKEENGIIYIDAIHHDGRNTFEIHKLNKKGKSIVNQENLYKEIYHAKYKLWQD